MIEDNQSVDEIMFRQIHPDFLVDGVPASNRFHPQSRDGGKLSVDRGKLTTPADSHALYTSAGKKSAAVFGVSFGEFASQQIPVSPDPLTATDDHPANPAHALADFSGHDPNKHKVIAKHLKRSAVSRGRLHP
jgi:hypothetical protein